MLGRESFINQLDIFMLRVIFIVFEMLCEKKNENNNHTVIKQQ